MTTRASKEAQRQIVGAKYLRFDIHSAMKRVYRQMEHTKSDVPIETGTRVSEPLLQVT